MLEKVGRKTKIIIQDYLEFAKSYLENPKLCSNSLRALEYNLCRQFNLDPLSISLHLVHKIVKKINFTYKRVSKMVKDRNDPELIEERKNVSNLLLTSIYNDKLVIFIDETGFNNNLTPIFGYSLLEKVLYYDSS